MATVRRGGEAAAVRGPLGERGQDSGWGGPRPAGNTAVEMATTGQYKTGDESNYGTNCFPASNILRASKEGSGRWMLARRATPRAWTEKGTTGKTPQQRRKPPVSVSVEENTEDHVLDEPFLMKHHHLKNPSDLCSVNISSQNLISAKEDDFEKFDCVAFINAAENLLTLEPFRKFPGLRELELSLNGLRNLKITAGDFLHLEDLDLSYNNLSPQDIWTLGDLSQLKVLRLTANRLQSLPPDLAGSWDSAHLRFPSLEVLSLDDNRLSDPSVFVSLSHLCSLRELNLDRNRISSVPYLHQAERRQFFLHPALYGDSFRAEWYKSLSSLWQQSRLPKQEDTEVPAELEGKKGQLGYVMLQNNRDPGRTGVIFNFGSPGCPVPVIPREGDPSASKTLPAPSALRDICAPFPELKRLSLAFNKIADETALLPVAFFPCLEELTFHNNPLTTTRSGQPPLLTQLLQHNLGIKLVRQKNVAVERWHFSIPLKASRKVTSHLPKVTKWPLMMEAPAKTFLWKQLPAAVEGARDAEPPSPAQPLHSISSATPVLEEGEGNSRPPPGSAKEDIPSFFMTQVEDVSRPLLRPVAEGRLEKRSEQRREGRSQVVPEQYKGYEELLGGDKDLDFIEPDGIQKNVQGLYYTQNPSLAYQDANSRLDSVQKPYLPQKKHGRLPSPPARKTKAEVLEGILMAMRNTSTITEVPLVSVLQKRKSNPRAYREAQRLMEEFQEVFKILPTTVGEEMAKLSDEAWVVKALLAEATSEQGSPEQLQLPESGQEGAHSLVHNTARIE
ncbi:X-ray radiation resistance-associated protein 1 [Chroicocephalus ridibundus]|uniref:X-ray radiation resistance-associated protein 1 n=1 Tax=Chroicocephalus ridibundus TaxID=1192867 RepID=UPI002FDEE1C7